MLHAIWTKFDSAIESATGKELKKGPRGGGRDLGKIVTHVLESDVAYLRRIASKFKVNSSHLPRQEHRTVRQVIVHAIDSAFESGLPEKGPRGGKIWPLRYYIHRSAWHIIDHIWEIEDRIIL